MSIKNTARAMIREAMDTTITLERNSFQVGQVTFSFNSV